LGEKEPSRAARETALGGEPSPVRLAPAVRTEVAVGRENVGKVVAAIVALVAE